MQLKSLFKKTAFLLFLVFLFLLLSLFLYYQHLNHVIINKFEGKKWLFPSKVYSESYLIYPGLILQKSFFERLHRLSYEKTFSLPIGQGQYYLNNEDDPSEFHIYLHNFHYPHTIQKGQYIQILLNKNKVTKIISPQSKTPLTHTQLERELIALIYKDVAEERRVVPLKEVPPDLLNAIIAIEDERFFEHRGVDPQGILRALLENLRKRRFAQGGSTLTQQLVKNFFLTREKSFRRKITEALMAFMIENRYSKDAILETYVNEIYFGNRGVIEIHGVAEAALNFFSKDLGELNLSECALLAGMIQAPNRYSPLTKLKTSLQRRDLVLEKMLSLGKIVRQEYVKAKREKISPNPSSLEIGKYASYFIDFIKSELRDKYSPETLSSEGLYIFTTLDVNLQKKAREFIENDLVSLEKAYPELLDNKGNPLQASLISVEPHTGFIRAMVGGRSYEKSQFNRVFQAKRQPGSLFKPFVYIAALEKNPQKYTASTILVDTPFDLKYDDQAWSPHNYDDTFRGDVSFRTALEQSINVPTAKLGWEVGIQNIIYTARRLGITSGLPKIPSLSLGSAEVTPLEIARAYATLANQGFKTHFTSIKEVMNQKGQILEKRDIELEQAISSEIAFLITYLLEGVMTQGTGRAAQEWGFQRPAAGKTGTTTDYKDAWFAGYTPDFATTVWVGFDQDKNVGYSGARAALPIWAHFMKTAHEDKPISEFQIPENIVFKLIDPQTGYLWTKLCGKQFKEAYLKGTEPRETCPVHKNSTQ